MITKQVGFTLEKETNDIIERFSGFTRISKSSLFRDWIYTGLHYAVERYLDDQISPPKGDFLDLLLEINSLLESRNEEFQLEHEIPDEARRFL